MFEDEQICAECRHWHLAEFEKSPDTETSQGYCRRFPPYVPCIGEDDGHGQQLMGYPLCFAGETCGEFLGRYSC